MWPWGHLAVGYLVYTGYLWVRRRQTPRGWPMVALAVGTQFPDLVDKPLAYSFAVLPAGRSLAHSYLVALPVAVGVLYGAHRLGVGQSGVAFVIGYLTHPIADGLSAILNGPLGELSYMVWPLLDPPPPHEAENFSYHWMELQATFNQLSIERVLTDVEDPFVRQIWLGVFLLLLWGVHGMPPLERLVVLFKRRG